MTRWRQPLLVLSLVLGLASAARPAALTGADWFAQGTRQYYEDAQPGPALDSLKKAVQLDPANAMAHLMLSRALWRAHRTDDAVAESETAAKDSAQASDEDGYIIKAWAAHLRATTHPSSDARGEGEAWDTINTGIGVYQEESAELYILAGEIAPTPLQATPYYLAALALQPQHPFGHRWKPVVPPLPTVNFTLSTPPSTGSMGIKLFDGLGQVHHVITTKSPKAQAYFDQGMCLLYGYVDAAARKSFSACLESDPQCAMAYWGLSFCAPPSAKPIDWAERALQLARDHGTDAEKRICSVRVLQLQRSHDTQALDALGGALAANPKDVELWMYRATYLGFAGESDDRRSLNGLPFALAAWHLAPTHPSANHEMVHTYEAINRPLLGWKYSWGFRRSAPNLPHAQHMQAHLAMRLGRWKEALACTRESVRLELAGFPELDETHHRNIYCWAMGHEGRFKEASTAPKSTAQDMSWPRLLRLELDDKALAQWSTVRLKTLSDGWYYGALADLDRGLLPAAQAKFKQFGQIANIWYGVDPDMWKDEVQGRLWLQHGQPEKGLVKLQELAKWSDSLPESHRWGQGAYYDELWGEAGLATHHLDQAQEAFQEALAHEHGSIVAALGLQVVWERRHNALQTKNFANLAQSIWSEADPGASDRLLARLRQVADAKAPIF